MRIAAIIQARMGSTRLPGKVLADLAGQPMLARVVNRTARAKTLDKVVVATTTDSADAVIADLCAQNCWPFFRGDRDDVLDRYCQAAKAHGAEVVVRITSDCPFIDPEIIDRVVRVFLEKNPDYASNTLKRTYPRGLDVEVVTLVSLIRACHECSDPYQRVHVTPYICQNPHLFQIISVTSEADYSDHRWTVDTPEDLEFARAVYLQLSDKDAFTWRDVLNILAEEPALKKINRYTQQKSIREG